MEVRARRPPPRWHFLRALTRARDVNRRFMGLSPVPSLIEQSSLPKQSVVTTRFDVALGCVWSLCVLRSRFKMISWEFEHMFLCISSTSLSPSTTLHTSASFEYSETVSVVSITAMTWNCCSYVPISGASSSLQSGLDTVRAQQLRKVH